MAITTSLEHLLQEPADFSEDAAHDWFAKIATALLNRCALNIHGIEHKLVEIEFYYSGELHRDPFTHCDPLQRTSGQWYLHRVGEGLRNGSFKGLDLTFGCENAFGGILIRSIECTDSSVVSGPSLCVDHAIKNLGVSSVVELDELLQEDESAIQLVELDAHGGREIFNSARFGLSLKKATDAQSQLIPYMMRRYRFLTRPGTVKKGRQLLVLALYIDGRSAKEIHLTTKTPVRTIESYIEVFELGRRTSGFDEFCGVHLTSEAVCRLMGRWEQKFGSQ